MNKELDLIVSTCMDSPSRDGHPAFYAALDAKFEEMKAENAALSELNRKLANHNADYSERVCSVQRDNEAAAKNALDLLNENARLRGALEKISCANKCVNSEFTAAYMRAVADVALEPFKEVIHGIQSGQESIGSEIASQDNRGGSGGATLNPPAQLSAGPGYAAEEPGETGAVRYVPPAHPELNSAVAPLTGEGSRKSPSDDGNGAPRTGGPAPSPTHPESEPVTHMNSSIIPFRADCGADEPNQSTTTIPGRATCQKCTEKEKSDG